MPSEKPKQAGDLPASDDVQSRLERRRKKREERALRRSEEGTEGRKRASSARRRRPFGEVQEDEDAPPPRRRPAPAVEPDRVLVEFDESAIDDSAAKVVRRLTRAGHEAYLVGGCVRDLLVGKRPKDFDVATSARPEEVRALFRNSRIIGRRFRLVHVLFPGGHVIETATFRRNPTQTSTGKEEDLLIRSDNVFGQAPEDAQRRDFTINGLFYDVDSREVLDWVGGMKHIRSREVQTIGDPVVRFQEDPVRMLRAVKFAARLDFGIAPEVYDAAVQCRGALAMAARPRLSEEVLRLMRGGASHRSIWLLWEMGMLDLLIPELSCFLADSETQDVVWALLREVDRLTEENDGPLEDTILWCALLIEPILESCMDAPDRARATQDFLEPIVERLNLPRRASDSVRRIVAMMPKLDQGRATRLKKNPLYSTAVEVWQLHRAARNLDAVIPEETSDASGKRTRKKRPRKKKPDA